MTSPMPDQRRPSPSRRVPIAILAGLLVLLAGAILVLRHDREAPQPPAPSGAARQLRAVTLYFAAPDGSGLVAEGRQVAEDPDEAQTLRGTLQALLDGPAGGLLPVLPPRTQLHGVTLGAGDVRIDFSRPFIDAHPGGSWSELMTVAALADTVAVNFPHLRQVRILVDGAPVDTIKGHVDLRQPVAPDFTLVLKSPAGDAAAQPRERTP